MASTPTRLMTFAEFEHLPDPKNGHHQELHHGELVDVPFPKMNHHRVQHRLRDLLTQAAGSTGVATTELGFRALPENEYRRADVAYVSKARWDAVDLDDYFRGAPELVVEVLSPSNTAAEIRDKRKLCLENGSREFWVADPDHREIEVWTSDGRSVTYRRDQQIPLFFAAGASISVEAIFE